MVNCLDCKGLETEEKLARVMHISAELFDEQCDAILAKEHVVYWTNPNTRPRKIPDRQADG